MKVVVTLTKKFFDAHPRAGEPTNFADLVKQGKKIHTCRDNFNYWIDKIALMKNVGGTLYIREWSGRPYRSPQDTIMEVPADITGVSELILQRSKHQVLPYRHSVDCYWATIDGEKVDIETLARNDGFKNQRDFTAFFDPLFDKYQRDILRLAIIHFTAYRYGKK